MSRRWLAIVLVGLASAGVLTGWAISQENAKAPEKVAQEKVSQEKAAPAAGKQPASPGKAAPAAADAASAEQAILQKLAEPTDLAFSETPLREALDRISQKHKLQIIPDARQLEEATVELDVPVTCSFKGLKLGQGLNLMLRDLGLAWIIRDEVLEITSREAADNFFTIRTYPVSDLIRLRGKPRDDEDEYAGLQTVVTRVIAADSWADAGGPGTLQFARGVMVVGQTAEKHAMVGRLLAMLRQARQQIGELKGEARLAVIDADEENAKVYAKLRRIVSISWVEKPLHECIAALATEQGLPIGLARKKLEDAQVSIDAPVTLKLSGVSLESALNHITRPLGLDWLVRDDSLFITSRDEEDTYLVVRIYPVPDLMPPGDAADDADSLLEVITNTVKPDSWQDTGGPGIPIACEGIGCLVCVQTRENHEVIDRLLAALRRDGAASAGVGRRRPMVLRIYKIGGPAATPTGQAADAAAKAPAKGEVSADDVAKIVRELVAPETWDAAGGKAYLRPLGERLIVRATSKVQAEVNNLLSRLGVLAGGDGFGGGFF